MIQKTIDLSSFTSIKIGPKVPVHIIQSPVHIEKGAFILGAGNNLLVSHKPPKFYMLSKDFDYIYIKDNLLHIGAATPSGKILSFAKRHNIAGFELMQKLPGTLGGMLKMNAGLKEWEVFNNLIAIKSADGWHQKSSIKHSYRHTDIDFVIYEATFKINSGFDNKLLAMFKKMRDNQPHLPSAGSCFKNPKGDFAGRLIEASGFKGYRIGDMSFSLEHANFLVNHGNGRYEDAIELITSVKKVVKEKNGIDLEEEIIIL